MPPLVGVAVKVTLWLGQTESLDAAMEIAGVTVPLTAIVIMLEVALFGDTQLALVVSSQLI